MFGEFGAIVATLILLVLTPAGNAAFWLTLAAFAALLVMHGLYWVLTHPVNKFWRKGQQMHRAGAAFFGAGGRGATSGAADDIDWTTLRDRWEYSDVARAVCAAFSLVTLVAAAAL